MLSHVDEPDRTPKIYLVRHGETAWTISGQHTGRTDIALTERGERDAQELSARLQGMTFASVLTSPLQRARRTCDLAGFGAHAEADADLLEWDYGASIEPLIGGLHVGHHFVAVAPTVSITATPVYRTKGSTPHVFFSLGEFHCRHFTVGDRRGGAQKHSSENRATPRDDSSAVRDPAAHRRRHLADL